ncbi:MAG: 2-amino-4-hydroxy-6-hydroxymethyldihydropteridine diphosphokinase [Phycisphaerales bacterium]|nr:2-amino-4-hydroxy-6-hydroxymethyldihydropteridine diphosphokinase [Phycisphaerales bacterium]
MPSHTAAIALGSNLGDRAAHIQSALKAIARLPHTELIVAAPSREYPPLPLPNLDPGGPYLNTCALIRTALDPRPLLDHLHTIERSLGRVRAPALRWSPRTIDLDLITYADRTMSDPELTLPHPSMHLRAFVLEPLAEIAPDLHIPGHGTVRDLLARLHAQGAPS